MEEKYYTNEKLEFREKLSLNLTNSLSCLPYIILLLFTCWKFYIPYFVLAGFFIFLMGYLTKITVSQDSLFCKTPFKKEISVKWTDITSVKPARFQGFVISWGIKEKQKFWAFKSASNSLRLKKEFHEFRKLLDLIICKSVNAVIDPRVHRFLKGPDLEKITRTSRIFGLFFIITFGICSFSLSKFVFEIEADTHAYFFYFLFTFLAFGLMAYLYSIIVGNLDGEKWLFLSSFFSQFCFFPSFFMFLLFSSTFTPLAWAMLWAVSAILFVCILSFSPYFRGQQLLSIVFGLSLLTFWVGNSYILNPQVKTEVLAKIENFISFGGGWFPDGTKIYIEGNESTGKGYDQEKKKILVFNVETKKLVKVLPTEGVLPHFSFYWSPDGQKLALIEYPKDKGRKLSLLDTGTLQRDFVYNAEHLSLAQYGCWNRNSTELTGTYTLAGENGEKKTVAFVFNTHTREIKPFQKEEKIESAFWLPDDNLGILCCKGEEDKKEGILKKYSIIQINSKTLGEKTIYTAKEYYKAAKVSPCGRFLLVSVKKGIPLIIDIFGHSVLPIDSKLSGEYTGGGHWAPDGMSVILPLQEGEKTTLAIYGIMDRKLTKVFSGMKNYLHSVNWSKGSQWFTFSSEDSTFFGNIFLSSRDGKKLIRVGRGGFLPMPSRQAGVNYDGSKVIYCSTTFLDFSGQRETKWAMRTIVFLSEIGEVKNELPEK